MQVKPPVRGGFLLLPFWLEFEKAILGVSAMHEEIEARRYYLEMPDARIASICVVLNELSGYSVAEPDFTVIVGLKEDARAAAHKATEIDALLQPAVAAKHGASIGDGTAVITLSYSCTSPYNDRVPTVSRKMPPAFILGLLASDGWLPMEHYTRIMLHVQAMDDMRLGSMGAKAPSQPSAQAWH